jgi:hypothetical protein
MGRPLVGPPHGAGSHAGAGAEAAGTGAGVHTHEPEASHSHPHPHPHVAPTQPAGEARPTQPAGEARPTQPAGEARPTQPSRGVVVDIGDDVGALVLYAEAGREWLEPEIHPEGEPGQRQHVWVLERMVGSGSVFAAVFPSLPEGRYGICSPEGETAQIVEILGGKVTEARWM